MASKSYGWDVRNIPQFSPKMAKKSIFSIFSIFSQTVHTIRTKASQKEKDLSRLLYRISGSGFSPDLFMKISNFSKTVHKIFIKFCSHSTSKWAHACSKASKSFDWNVRNIAKISPKTAIFRLFAIFSKTVHAIRTKVSTVILHHIRVLYVQWH